MNSLDKIKHVVVLMLENRSFDNLLGGLYPKSDTFDGVSGSEFNLDQQGQVVSVWHGSGNDVGMMNIPDPDPGELWLDMNMQLFGVAQPSDTAVVPPMNGFVKNYQCQTDQPAGDYVAKAIMHYYTPEQVPVLSQLAKQFAVCDRWFASAPCQTWPNRFFVHTGTANGYENNWPPHFPYEMPTIFNRFQDLNIEQGWKIYFHDMPQSLALSALWPHLNGFHEYDTFKQDAQKGTLPSYSFIEPRYFADTQLPNDQHPPHVVTLGEQLIADVYNSLRNGPAWTETLLIITYDEHGGCYDHVPPPQTIPPNRQQPTQPFNFDRYGVRVPAVIVSPYIPANTVLRPEGEVPYDHTSILSTLRKRFNLGEALSERDAVAPDLAKVLSLSTPENLGPTHLEALPYEVSATELTRALSLPMNAFQMSLLNLAKQLPALTGSYQDWIHALQSAVSAINAGSYTVAGAVQSDAQAIMDTASQRLKAVIASL